MQKDLAKWAARHYGAVSGLRSQAVEAIAVGDHSAAIGLSIEALQLNHAVLSELDLSEPSALPHQALGRAVISDLEVAGISDIIFEPNADAGFLVNSVRELAVPRNVDIVPLASARRCPHHRPSFDGWCMAIPPCPDES